MNTSDPVTAFAQAVRESAAAAASLAVEGWPQPGHETADISLDPAELVLAIGAARPKLVYIIEFAFDADVELESAYEALGFFEDPGLAITRRFADLGKRAARRNNEPTTTVAGFFYEGVLHSAQVTADWSTELDAEFTARVEEIRAEGEALALAAESAVADVNRKLALQLTRHAAFNVHPVSIAKRRFLAGELFKDLEPDTLSRVTELAEMIAWAQKGGVTFED